MPDLIHERELYTKALEEDLESLVEQLRAMPEVRKVVLFGSYSQGRSDLFTDLDLLVVMESDRDFVIRSADLAGELKAGVALDLLVYTPEELENIRERPFIRHALETGKMLYERESQD
jgi:predicted nucleotidyltransferase